MIGLNCATKLSLSRLRKCYIYLWIWSAIFLFLAFNLWKQQSEEPVDESLINNLHFTSNLTFYTHTKIKNTYPGVVWWTDGLRLFTEVRQCEDKLKCHFFQSRDRYVPENVGAYLFYASSMNLKDFPLPRSPENLWGLFHEESPRNVPELMHEKALNLFNFSSTFSRYSDVPIPLAHLKSIDNVTSTKYFIKTDDKNSLLGKISPILYLQSDCQTSTHRDEYVKKLMEYIPVDSYGKCLNNKALPDSLTNDYLNKLNDYEPLKFIAKYKFMIAIENGVCEDYVTEKFWRAISVGTVPIYFGSPSVRDWFPNNQSAILIQDYDSPKKLSEYLIKLNNDDNLYEQHLEHKIKGTIANKRLLSELELRNYQTDTFETLNVFECFICKKLHDKSYVTVQNMVNSSHYNCPKPASILKSENDASNMWINVWEVAKVNAEKLYRSVEQSNKFYFTNNNKMDLK